MPAPFHLRKVNVAKNPCFPEAGKDCAFSNGYTTFRPMKTYAYLPIAIALLALPVLTPAASDCCDVPSFIPEPPELFAVSKTKGSITLPASADAVTLDWPIASFVLNSPFGPRQLGSAGARYDWHRGTDLKVPIGTPVVAPADAFVVFSGVHPGFADPVIQLRHNSEAPFLYTLYLHMSVTSAVAGETIAAGTEIGLSGQGTASYPHLHWEVRRGCLNQRCCENVYSYMTVGSAPPPGPPVVAAAGDSPNFGRMLLLEFSFPEDEIDFNGVEIEWGATTVSANLNLLNQLTGTLPAARLDDPLFFAEKEGLDFVFFPKRFNESFDSADYQFLAWNLGPATSGNAKVLDALGNEAAAAISIDLPPISVVPSAQNILLVPGGEFTISYEVTNNDTVSRTLDFERVSAQSLTLSLSSESTTLAPSASTTITVGGTVPASFPEDIGDVVLLITTVQGGAWTPLLSTTGIDTSNAATAESWAILGDGG